MKNCLQKMIFFMSFTASVFGQTNTTVNPDGYNTFYYPNGKIASEGAFKNGREDGYWKTYYVTGVLRSEGNRFNTLLDSTWIFYTQTGDTLEVINYRLGRKSGYFYRYETITERNSVSRHYLKSRELFLDDRREGLAYYYYPDGAIRQTVYYRNGRKQGESREYDENGTVIARYEYINDYMTAREYMNRVNSDGEKTGVWKTFYPDGKLKEEEFYRDGILEGSTLVYSEKGNLVSGREELGNDGEVQTQSEPVEMITYYDDGVTVKHKGVYLDSIPLDYHYFYDSSGKPEKAIRYRNGVRMAEGPVDENEKRTGEWKNYSETGKLRSSGRFVNDRQDGEWSYFSPDGKKEQVGNFRNGVIEGAWVWYFPTGNPFREEIYVRGKLNGLNVQYSDSATVVTKGEYLEGEREGVWIENIGDAREEGSYVMGLKNGMWRTYYRDEQLYHAGNFVQGSPDGRHVFYYPDGTLKEEQYYVMGRRDKNWKKYYENGGLFLTVTYKNDEEIRINGIRIEDAKGK